MRYKMSVKIFTIF